MNSNLQLRRASSVHPLPIQLELDTTVPFSHSNMDSQSTASEGIDESAYFGGISSKVFLKIGSLRAIGDTGGHQPIHLLRMLWEIWEWKRESWIQ